MTLKFKFKKQSASSHVPHPIIPINLINQGTGYSFDTDALVDCGASKNLFPASIAKEIGIEDIADTEVGRNELFGGIAGQKVTGYPHRLTLEVGSAYHFETLIYFIKDMEQEIPILGIKGFLDHFIVKLVAHQERIELTPVKSL